MIYKVFSVYDAKVLAYLQPFFMRTVGEAIRGFTDLCNDSSTQFNKYKEDYILFELGEFDDSNSVFTMRDNPHSLGKAIEFVRVE